MVEMGVVPMDDIEAVLEQLAMVPLKLNVVETAERLLGADKLADLFTDWPKDRVSSSVDWLLMLRFIGNRTEPTKASPKFVRVLGPARNPEEAALSTSHVQLSSESFDDITSREEETDGGTEEGGTGVVSKV